MKILIIKLHYIGDVVMITPAIRWLRHAIPNAQLDILIGNWSRQVVDNNPSFSRKFTVPDGVFTYRKPWNLVCYWTLLKELKAQKYDGVLIFHHHPWIVRFGRAISAPITIAYHPEIDDSPHYSLWDPSRHGVQNALALVRSFCQRIGCELEDDRDSGLLQADWVVTDEEVTRAKEILASVGISESPIIVHPGAGLPRKRKGREKQWFPERFAELITEIQANNLSPIALEGAGFERSLAEEIQSLLPTPVVSIVGLTNLRELAAVLSLSRMLITNDTGTMHIGGAVRVPVVAIFGPTGADKFLPLGGPFVGIQSRVPCSPCNYGSFQGCLYQQFECMKEISVERVRDAALQLLNDLRSVPA
jgi:ADP-heptose:LPS heptosyltransferase